MDHEKFDCVDRCFVCVVFGGPTLTSITVTPNKTSYLVGDSFNPSDLVVTGTYAYIDDGEESSAGTNIIPSQYVTVANFDSTVPNSKETLTVSVDAKSGLEITPAPTTTYDVVINPQSSDDTLNALIVSAGTLSPAFASGTLSYIETLPTGTTSVPMVTAIANVTTATAVVTQATDLTGSTTVLVTAQDGTHQTYKINFTVTPTPILGCMDSTATNYNASATQSNNSCTYNVVSSGGGGGGGGGSSVYESIAASAGSNGTISPSGTTSVALGNSQTYMITPASGYRVASVLVDGTSVGSVTSYVFTSVNKNHTISVTFEAGSTTSGKSGDINGDGGVDELDFSIMMSQWGQTGITLSADLNHDGVIDELDFSILMANWGL